MQTDYDIIIIGSGPAGYVAAIRSAQVGLKTALVEKAGIGGMCIHWGCIRMKTLMESAKFYKRIQSAADFGIDVQRTHFNWERVKARAQEISKNISGNIALMLNHYGVDVIVGEGNIPSENRVSLGEKVISSENIVIATGSVSDEPAWGLKNVSIIDPATLFNLDSIPENIIISGQGPVALEMAQFFNLIGKHVNIVAPEGSILPAFDVRLQDFILEKMQNEGIGLHTGRINHYENGALFVDGVAIACDIIINCDIRKPVLPLSDLNFELDSRGFLKADNYFETNVKGIFAIGDVTGKSYLAHTASAQGISVVNHIKKIDRVFAMSQFPMNCYTTPEISQLGFTEEQVRKEGIQYKISEYPLSANSKAVIEGNAEGFIRILSEKKSGHVLGVQIAAEHATDMISEAAAYMQMGGTVFDIAKGIHAHPTISEIYTEAGLNAIDHFMKSK